MILTTFLYQLKVNRLIQIQGKVIFFCLISYILNPVCLVSDALYKLAELIFCNNRNCSWAMLIYECGANVRAMSGGMVYGVCMIIDGNASFFSVMWTPRSLIWQIFFMLWLTAFQKMVSARFLSYTVILRSYAQRLSTRVQCSYMGALIFEICM